MFIPTFIIIDKFESVSETSFMNKEDMIVQGKIFNDINLKIGRYTDNAIVFVHPKSEKYLLYPGKLAPKTHADLSHLNIRIYQKEFIATDLAKKYVNKFIVLNYHIKTT